MVRKTVSELRNSRSGVSDSDLAAQIGAALQGELGTSRRATKSVMRWTGVSDTAARAWLHGRVSPSAIHMVALAANSDAVMTLLLELTGHKGLKLGLEVQTIEKALVQALVHVQSLEGRDDNAN